MQTQQKQEKRFKSIRNQKIKTLSNNNFFITHLFFKTTHHFIIHHQEIALLRLVQSIHFICIPLHHCIETTSDKRGIFSLFLNHSPLTQSTKTK